MTNLTQQEEISGQRRWAAILFADVVGSTELSETLGADNFYGLMRDLMRGAWSIVEKRHGHTVEFGGDSLLAIFGAPVAVENASLNACETALEIQSFLSENAEQFEKLYGHAPQMRIGLGGGVVTVGDLSISSKMSLNVLGSAVNRASRLEGMAQAGEVLISTRIRDQVENHVELEALGDKTLKGFSEPEPVFRLKSVLQERSAFQMRLRRGAKDFAGRDAELDILTKWAGQDQSEAPVIEIVGQAGIGKSRLFYELGSRLGQKIRLLKGNCEIGRRSASFYPLVGLLRSYLNWAPDQPVSVLTAQMASAFGPQVVEAHAFVDLLAGTAGGSARAERENAIEIRAELTRALRVLSRQSDIAILIEDAHWMDSTSADLLSEMVASGDLRIAVTRRPDKRMEGILSGTVRHLQLSPLSTEGLASIIRSVLGAAEIPDNLLKFVTQTSDGLPLFAEEVVQFLKQDGQIQIENGKVTFEAKDGTLREAGNLQHIILSGFDGLSSDAQSCLKFAATKGRRFSVGFLEKCTGDNDAVLAAVDEVTNLGIAEIDPRGGRRALRFSHALVGETIYESILKAERTRLHLQVGAALETVDGSTAAELAFHFSNGEDPDKAVQYFWQAASESMSVYAVDIADVQLERAFELIEADPDIVGDRDYGEMLLLHCRALDIFGNFRRVNEVVEQRGGRLEAIGPSRNYVICLTLQALSRCHGGNYPLALDLIEQATRDSEAIGDEASKAWVKAAKLRIYGDTEAATIDELYAIYKEVRPVAERLQDGHMIQACIYNMQACFRGNGQTRKAEKLIDELEAYGLENRDSRAMAYANWAKAVHCFTKRDPVKLREATQTVFEHAVPGTADWRVAGLFDVAIGLLEEGEFPDPEAFTPIMQTSRDIEDFTLHHTTWIGRMMACFKSGKIARGRQEMRDMTEDVRVLGTNELQRIMLLYQAEILLALMGLRRSTGPKPKLGAKDLLAFAQMRLSARGRAKALFEKYLKDTNARTGPLVARAHHGLGLLAKSGRRAEVARDHLELAREFFDADGYDLAAQEVRQSLDELGA
ncbi:ATP-binding protein [Shimia abyssi]|uniref:AAA ATPase-like protein n=1 Tax=Shimia abyssi TaxID=1662395 RepID=A0A2P8F9T3_9RHOB|nr:adenylate/guanylate cyclase domain-containing protein [Shimia abyssi]PSL18470.1 AAA ATPase-like protein [Shimia abyssi]